MQPPNNYPRFNPGPPSDAARLWDRICGGVCFASALCSMGVGVFASALMSMFAGAAARSGSLQGAPPIFPIVGASIAIVMIVLVGIGILELLIGWGMWNSRKWAFIAAIPVYGLCALGSSRSVIGAVIGLGLVIYSICRLTGSIGPKPV